jgi:hypothetical protein
MKYDSVKYKLLLDHRSIDIPVESHKYMLVRYIPSELCPLSNGIEGQLKLIELSIT